MKALNLNGKIMIIPMAALDEKVRNAIKQEDGLQNIGGTDIFVYATGRLEEHPHQCCITTTTKTDTSAAEGEGITTTTKTDTSAAEGEDITTTTKTDTSAAEEDTIRTNFTTMTKPTRLL